MAIALRAVAGPVVEGATGLSLDKAVSSLDAETPGFSGVVLVARGGKVLLEKGYGFADAAEGKRMPHDALVDWASVSKQFTAAAVLKLAQARKLSIDDFLSERMPGVPADKAGVRIRDLLDHTSGIEAGFRNEWQFDPWKREGLEKLVLGLPVVSKAGEKFAYSNSGYALAAAIVERISGREFEEYCIAELFRPAGMKEATFIGRKGLDLSRVPLDDGGRGVRFAYGDRLHWGYRGCGGVVATVRDLFQWDRALRGAKILDAASKQALYTPRLENYALGWMVLEGPKGVRSEHSGGVGKTCSYYLRSSGDDIVVAFVLTCVPSLPPTRIAEMLYRIAAGLE